MATCDTWRSHLAGKAGRDTLEKLYVTENTDEQLKRYNELLNEFESTFQRTECQLFSTPGRTEIGGNHTDHNQGRVLAASVNLDAIAAAASTDDSRITLISQGFPPFSVDLGQLSPVDSEQGSTESLIRGIAARFKELGHRIGGFQAVMTSDVLTGSGLSSSAAVEVLIASIFNGLYNDGSIKAEGLAVIGQYAENRYFGKPCGLMDQTACAVGGIVTIDFADPDAAAVEQVAFDFAAMNYALCVVDTGGDHADLTDDYAAIPKEMKAVAALLGHPHLRPVTLDDIHKNMAMLRAKAGDRAVLRAMHFIDENQRVEAQVYALESSNFYEFLNLIYESGLSSHRWLQNVAPIHHTEHQPIGLALSLAEQFIDTVEQGAVRVHGGGFAGTIQVFLPTDDVQDFIDYMTPAFGPDAVKPLSIRPVGTFQWKDPV